ncbi:acyl carrier protein [Vibrio mangrovi]|uniref:Acyl carrier protein n=1 Tax=Vibrio mangrovi TaxID=474394 RepID=A0A1Y6ISD0_9VIBR|nr:acyl carrier protein [Vibrio mangrovi]MDW6003271.1 acyl carrier protein [Vibrio mangrovi]SMR99941.1 acyl carrier protein [Vibrio mangrovi]
MEKEKIRDFVLYLLHRNGDKSDIGDDESLIESKRFDSLDIAELTLFIQDEYNIYISSSDSEVFRKIDTVNLIEKYINEERKATI